MRHGKIGVVTKRSN